METVTDFIFGGSKITVGVDYSHEIKRRLLLGRKVMTNLDSIFKSRNITLPTKVHLVKAMVFPVVMYGCESWTIKKAEQWGIDAFELWCWGRLLRVPWTARRSNQSILKEISPEYSFTGRTDTEAETPILWPPDAKNWLSGKDPDAGKDWRQEEKGTTEDEMVGWHHWLNGHEFEQALGVGDEQRSLACCSPLGRKESDMTEQLNWTELICVHRLCYDMNFVIGKNITWTKYFKDHFFIYAPRQPLYRVLHWTEFSSSITTKLQVHSNTLPLEAAPCSLYPLQNSVFFLRTSVDPDVLRIHWVCTIKGVITRKASVFIPQSSSTW